MPGGSIVDGSDDVGVGSVSVVVGSVGVGEGSVSVGVGSVGVVESSADVVGKFTVLVSFAENNISNIGCVVVSSFNFVKFC